MPREMTAQFYFINSNILVSVNLKDEKEACVKFMHTGEKNFPLAIVHFLLDK